MRRVGQITASANAVIRRLPVHLSERWDLLLAATFDEVIRGKIRSVPAELPFPSSKMMFPFFKLIMTRKTSTSVCVNFCFRATCVQSVQPPGSRCSPATSLSSSWHRCAQAKVKPLLTFAERTKMSASSQSQVGVTYNNEVLVSFTHLRGTRVLLRIELITILCIHVVMETKAIRCQMIEHQ